MPKKPLEAELQQLLDNLGKNIMMAEEATAHWGHPIIYADDFHTRRREAMQKSRRKKHGKV